MKGGDVVHILAKPVGAACNLRCDYCFYLEKANFYGQPSHRMESGMLEKFIEEYIKLNDAPEVQFVWQGGEPMLAGLDFYKMAVDLQRRHNPKHRKIINTLQTNGILLNEEWCEFLQKQGFVVGISLDGPDFVTDAHRRDAAGKGAFAQIMRGVKLLQRYRITFNALACVTAESVEYPDDIYCFFKENGIYNLQFTPVVERMAPEWEQRRGQRNAAPATAPPEDYLLSPWSVPQGAYGRFLTAIFGRWVKEDVGKVFVMNFEWALCAWMGLPSTVCTFAKHCGACVMMEHEGSLYSCDHYMYPEYWLGNLAERRLSQLVFQQKQREFATLKSALPQGCRECAVAFACQGECPRHRFAKDVNGEAVSYLCGDYQAYFRHIHPHMKAMAQLLQNGYPAARIMTLKEQPIVILPVGGNG